MTAEVPLQRRPAAGVIDQDEGCELRQVEPLVEDEVGLKPRVGEKHLAAQLRQCVAIHLFTPREAGYNCPHVRAIAKACGSSPRSLADTPGNPGGHNASIAGSAPPSSCPLRARSRSKPRATAVTRGQEPAPAAWADAGHSPYSLSFQAGHELGVWSYRRLLDPAPRRGQTHGRHCGDGNGRRVQPGSNVIRWAGLRYFLQRPRSRWWLQLVRPARRRLLRARVIRHLGQQAVRPGRGLPRWPARACYYLPPISRLARTSRPCAWRLASMQLEPGPVRSRLARFPRC